MTTYAVTAVGPDAPGEVAALAAALAGLGANLEDASMTRLRGHFAMTLVAEVPAGPDRVDAALAEVAGRSGLHVAAWDVGADAPPAPAGPLWRVTLHGADRTGLVAAVTGAIAAGGANITDLSCRLVEGLYVMTVEVEAATAPDLGQVAAGLGVQVHVAPLDEDVL